MKILTYNLLLGGWQRENEKQDLSQITKVLKQISADFVALQEANNFEIDDERLLKKLASELECPYYDLSQGGKKEKWGRHNAVSLSKLPFKDVNRFEGEFRNAALQTVIGSSIGNISICNTHLTPKTEEERLVEVGKVLDIQSRYENSIILGDINSLSPQDNYDEGIVSSFNKTQLNKFTRGEKLQFDVMSKILEGGFIDVAVEKGANNTPTVPTGMDNMDEAHITPLRLDYILITKPLLPYLEKVEVIKTDTTETASDHYPVLLDLSV